MAKLEINAVCDKCGKDLKAGFTRDTLYVESCEKCLEEEYNRGYDDASEEEGNNL